MSKTVFLSPSRQREIVGNGSYGTEARRMNELANIIEAELERNGVYVERETNEIEVAERVALANKYKVDAYVSLHSNYAPENMTGTLFGTEIYVKNECEISKNLAQSIVDSMKNIECFIEKGIKNGDKYTEIVGPVMPSIMIEIDYHDNYDRAYWIIEHMYEIAIAITKGILKHFNINYTEKTKQQYYHVILGSLTSKNNAEKLSRELADKGYPTVVKYY